MATSLIWAATRCMKCILRLPCATRVAASPNNLNRDRPPKPPGLLCTRGREIIEFQRETSSGWVRNVQQCRFFSRHKSDVKTIKRNRKPLTARLDVGFGSGLILCCRLLAHYLGFFTSPALEEGLHLILWGKGKQLLHFRGGKVTLGNFLGD